MLLRGARWIREKKKAFNLLRHIQFIKANPGIGQESVVSVQTILNTVHPVGDFLFLSFLFRFFFKVCCLRTNTLRSAIDSPGIHFLIFLWGGNNWTFKHLKLWTSLVLSYETHQENKIKEALVFKIEEAWVARKETCVDLFT